MSVSKANIVSKACVIWCSCIGHKKPDYIAVSVSTEDKQYYIDESKAAPLKSCSRRPSANSGATFDFVLNSSRVYLSCHYI
jgi:hypothetical protein